MKDVEGMGVRPLRIGNRAEFLRARALRSPAQPPHTATQRRHSKCIDTPTHRSVLERMKGPPGRQAVPDEDDVGFDDSVDVGSGFDGTSGAFGQHERFTDMDFFNAFPDDLDEGELELS